MGVDVTACEMVEDSIRVESVVRGHHVYKELWTPGSTDGVQGAG